MPNDEGLFTQAEIDALIGKMRREALEQFADEDDSKAKVVGLDKATAGANELNRELEGLNKAQERREALESELPKCRCK